MSFISEQTWKQIANFAAGSNLSLGGVNPPSSYVQELPTLFARNSGEWILDCFEYYESSTSNLRLDFSNLATAILYIKEADTIDEPIAIGTVVVEQDDAATEYNRLRANWDIDEITDYFAGRTVVFYIEVLCGADDKRTVYQRVAVENQDGAALINPETKDIPTTDQDITATLTLDSWPGLVVYFVDSSAGAITITLPDPADYESQEIQFIIKNNDNDVDWAGTVNGDAGGFESLAGEFKGSHLFSDGVAWFNLNYTTVIIP